MPADACGTLIYLALVTIFSGETPSQNPGLYTIVFNPLVICVDQLSNYSKTLLPLTSSSFLTSHLRCSLSIVMPLYTVRSLFIPYQTRCRGLTWHSAMPPPKLSPSHRPRGPSTPEPSGLVIDYDIHGYELVNLHNEHHDWPYSYQHFTQTSSGYRNRQLFTIDRLPSKPPHLAMLPLRHRLPSLQRLALLGMPHRAELPLHAAQQQRQPRRSQQRHLRHQERRRKRRHRSVGPLLEP